MKNYKLLLSTSLIFLAVSCKSTEPSKSSCKLELISDGLVGYWSFNGDANDYSGNNNHGEPYGITYTEDTPSSSDGQYSAEFNNGFGPTLTPAQSYVTIPHNQTLMPTTAITLSAWIKIFPPTPNFKASHIISKPYGTSYHDSYLLWYEGTGYLHFAISDGVNDVLVGTPVPSFNEWHHVVGIWDGSFLRLCVDGDEVDTREYSGAIAYDEDPVLIGADDNDQNDIPDEGWNGLIDEVRIYNRAP